MTEGGIAQCVVAEIATETLFVEALEIASAIEIEMMYAAFATETASPSKKETFSVSA
ncbi:MAG: hypothetical protein ACOX4V_05900 [Anaerovoracaceae bacterium]|jgi:hypothetical protein